MNSNANRDGNEGDVFARRIPGHLVPLDTEHEWVMSTLEGRQHMVQGGCRYATIIDWWNRRYRDTTPPEKEMCGHCRIKWRRLQKVKPLAL